jgi:uncharacterized cupredoxin-like copper-binding protein
MTRARAAALIAGALLIVALVGWARADEGPRTVDVTIHFSRFSVSSIPVSTGETVRFVIRNEDPIDHEFIVGDRYVQLVHENGTEPSHGPKPGEVTVPAGATAETTYTFPATPAHIEFACHLPGHYAYGMHGLFVFG